MKKKLIGENVEPKCEYCQFGAAAPDGLTVLCPKTGVSDKDASCKKYRYDPLKRVPRPAPEMLSFTADDFSLD